MAEKKVRSKSDSKPDLKRGNLPGSLEITLLTDDDLYLFINGRLAIECGGFHEAIVESLYLDSFYLAEGAHLTAGEQYDVDIFFVERRMGGNFFIAFSDSGFLNKGTVQVDPYHDTVINYRDTLVIDTIKCVGIDSRFEKHHIRRFLGSYIPPSTEDVALEYFTISGAKVMERKLPLSLALSYTSVSLPRGMYIIRVNFLNAQGKRLSRSSYQRMLVRK